MTPATGRQPDTLASIYEPIQSEMAQVEWLIEEKLATADALLEPVIAAAQRYRGKRLRPALVLLTARSHGRVTDQHIAAAAAVELLHNASLMHDDVIDAAEMRRQCASMNRTWGDEITIVVGDFFFAAFLEALGEVRQPAASAAIARCVRELCTGELTQLVRRGQVDVSESEYLAIAEHKTAALLAAACEAAAHISAAPAAPHAAFGRKLGVAFQIIDDCLDFAGSEHAAGKSLGSDLFTVKLTLPAIYLLEAVPPALRRETVELLTTAATPYDRRRVADLMNEFGTLATARATAHRIITEAKCALDPLPQGTCKDALITLADYVLDRSG